MSLGFRMHAERTPNPNSVKWVLGQALVPPGLGAVSFTEQAPLLFAFHATDIVDNGFEPSGANLFIDHRRITSRSRRTGQRQFERRPVDTQKSTGLDQIVDALPLVHPCEQQKPAGGILVKAK